MDEEKRGPGRPPTENPRRMRNVRATDEEWQSIHAVSVIIKKGGKDAEKIRNIVQKIHDGEK